MSTIVLVKTVSDVISGAFRRRPEIAQKCFRVKNLQNDEVASFIAVWRAACVDPGLTPVRLVVAESLNGIIPAEFVAEPGRSITFYRNNNTAGLIYLETRVQSDEQGLQNLFTLRDSNFLDGSFDEDAGVAGGVPELLVRNAWRESSGKAAAAPSLLIEKILLVLHLIHPDVEPVPVRRFVDFACECCRSWPPEGAAIDAAAVDRLVGEALWYLDMFPDPLWCQGETDSRLRRRLELNARHADLVAAGAELDPDELRRAAAATSFVNEAGETLKAAEIARYRQLCTNYVSTVSDAVRKEIPYPIFEQLFKRDTTGLKLGDKVRSEVDQREPGRVAELDAADVVPGLNSRSQPDAERFLALGAPEGMPPIADLLTNRTRKAVERIAAPPARGFFNPAIEIVRALAQIGSNTGGPRPTRVELNAVDTPEGQNFTVGLFAFLFGEMLSAISDAVSGVPGAVEFVVGTDLITQRPVPHVEDGTNGVEPEQVVWEPLQLRLRVLDQGGRIIDEIDGLKWGPPFISSFALMWLLSVADDSPVWNAIGALSYSDLPEGGDWAAPFVQRLLPLSKITYAPSSMGLGSDPLIDELLVLRGGLRDRFRTSGLSSEGINAFVDVWQSLIERVRIHYIPDGNRPPVLEAFLGTDTLAITETRRTLMLPFQPIRLRWISRYLERCERLATQCLEGRTLFSAGDGTQYLSWLEELTPHEAPPTASGEMGQILFARTEFAWFEDFAPLEGVKSDVTVDYHALDAIASRIAAYLEVHPYKRDGLCLLILLPPSDDMAAELVQRLDGNQQPKVRLSITVAAPKSRWEAIARLVEALPSEERGTLSGRLLPARDLRFVEYSAGDSMYELQNGAVFDIALVTHLLQEGVLSQQNTEPAGERAGAFNPLIDRPLRLESGVDGGAISIVMRPRDPDPMLETWGTLVVRSNRTRPVSPTQPENTDFVELRVNFQDAARVFKVLHDKSHWVITLEKHISRDQIESVEAGSPDVLSVESDIGSNGLSTLIVSSRAGRELIISRLTKKLRKLVPGGKPNGTVLATTSKLAARIYDETRSYSPQLTLQALGVSRVTEEILGLCIARHIGNQVAPDLTTDGVTTWISLDEHANWLDGSSNLRADMVRIALERDQAGTLNVDVLVLEGKLRQNYDPHGVSQVEKTCEFFRSILMPSKEGQRESVDAEMWRDRLLSAMENVSASARKLAGEIDPTASDKKNQIPNDVRQRFRDGKYALRTVKGLYSACLWESNNAEIMVEDRDGLSIVISSRVHILQLIDETAILVRRSSAGALAISAAGSVAKSSALQSSAPPEDSLAERIDIDSRVSTVAAETKPVVEPMPRAEAAVAPDTRGDANPANGHRMDRLALVQIYNEILSCFASHNVSVNAAAADETPFTEGPASILFRVRAGFGVDPRKLTEKAQALKLRLALDQEQNVSFGIDQGFVTIDVPKRPEDRYFVSAAAMWRRWTRDESALCVPIGEGMLGEIVSINFSSPNSPHLLVAGTTGSGKSEALNTILFGLVRAYPPTDLRLLLIDPKGTELVSFEGSAYLDDGIGWDDSDAIKLLEKAVAEMQRRYVVFRGAAKRSLTEYNASVSTAQRMPWWVLVLDEYADLTSDAQSKKLIENELKRLAQKARAAGIHIIIATQKPSAEVISTNLRSNLPAQLALRVKSATESRVVIDEAGADALNGKGDALFKASGKVTRLQCARVDPRDQVIPKGDNE